MPEEWHYLEGGLQRGPVSGASLKAMLDAGAIPADSAVWREGLGEWIPASAALAPGDSNPPAPADVPAAAPSARRRINGWLIAWQIATLIFLSPIVLTVGLWLLGVRGVLEQTGVLIACAASSAFVIAMFWRKRWAVLGFVGTSVLLLIFLIQWVVLAGRAGGYTAMAMVPPLACILSVGLLAGALRLGGQDAGWPSFS
ncbi:MAG: DUF4339 domain-containing protein [Coriobacteriia bacterium]